MLQTSKMKYLEYNLQMLWVQDLRQASYQSIYHTELLIEIDVTNMFLTNVFLRSVHL